MKGIVFTEFMEFVADCGNQDLVDDVIADCELPHGGAYTSVGTYPFHEMQRLVVAFCRRTRLNTDEVLRAFGARLCVQFSRKYPEFFNESDNLFDFLESVDRHIHVEVYKLYTDAELPKFRTSARDTRRLLLDYSSCRPLEALAEGMIEAAARHFGEAVTVSRSRVENEPESYTRFVIDRAA